MIYYLEGTLTFTYDDFIVVNVNGVGYQVLIPDTVRQSLPSKGDLISLFIFHHIREDHQQLFGFLTQESRQFFEVLTSISGVGPKVGIKILSAISVDQFVNAILSENTATLIQIPGIGKKMAERMIVELKDKLSKIYDVSNLEITPYQKQGPNLGEMEDDLISVLKSLKYRPEEIKKAISKAGDALSAEYDIEHNIKILLQNLS